MFFKGFCCFWIFNGQDLTYQVTDDLISLTIKRKEYFWLLRKKETSPRVQYSFGNLVLSHFVSKSRKLSRRLAVNMQPGALYAVIIFIVYHDS